jgi:phage-related protein
MTRELVPGEKPLYWIGSALKDLARFPFEVQRTVGFALSAAQYGGKHPSAKPWKGEGPGILEVVKDGDDGSKFRRVAVHLYFSSVNLRSKRCFVKSRLVRFMSPRVRMTLDRSLNPNPNIRSGFPPTVLQSDINVRISSFVKSKEQSVYHFFADTRVVFPRLGAYIPKRITKSALSGTSKRLNHV